MILIVVKFNVLPQFQDSWPSITRAFTADTRNEEGNLWFEWSRSIDRDDEYVLVEAFRDTHAGETHVASDHFRQGLESIRPTLAETPLIIHTEVASSQWSHMAELAVNHEPPTDI